MALYERMPDFQDEEVLSQAEELELVEGCVPLLSSIRIAVKSLRLAIVEDIVDPSALEDEIFHVFIKPARALRPTPRIDTWEVTDVDVDDIRRYYLGPTVWINKLRDALSESPPDLDPKSRTGVLWKLKECQRETDKALALLDVKTFVRQARQHLQSNDEESWKNASDALEHAHLVAMAEIYRTGDNPRYQGIAPAISLMDQSIARDKREPCSTMSYYRLKDILEEAKIAVSAFADEEVLSELRNRALDQTSTLLRAWEGIKDSASRTDAVLVTDRDFKQLTEQIVKSLRRFPHSRPNVPDSEWTQEKKTVSSKANRHEATAEDKMAATAMWFDEAQGVFESWKTGLSDEEVAFKLTEEDGSVNYALSQAIYFLRRPASDDRASEER